MGHTRQLLYTGHLNVYAPTNNDTQQRCYWPANDIDLIGWQNVEFYFWIEALGGAPTSARLTAKLQKAWASTNQFEYAVPAWRDFRDSDVARHCADGLGYGAYDNVNGITYRRPLDATPASVHDSSLSASVGYGFHLSVVDPPSKLRTVLTPTFTGDATPYYQIVAYIEGTYA